MNISELINREVEKLEQKTNICKLKPKIEKINISEKNCEVVINFLNKTFSEYVKDINYSDKNTINFSLCLNNAIHAKHFITYSCNQYFYDFDHVKSYKTTDELIPLIVKDIAKIIYEQKIIEKNTKTQFWKF